MSAPHDPVAYLSQRLEALSLDAFEIYSVENRLFSAVAKDGEIEATHEADERGVAIRIGVGSRTAFGCTSDLSAPFLDKMLKTAQACLPFMSEESPLLLGDKFSKEKNLKATPLPSVSRNEGMDLALQVENAARQFDPKIKRVRDARYSEEIRNVRILNSKGLDCQGQDSRFSLSLQVVAEENGDDQMAWDEQDSEHFIGLKPEELGRSVSEKAISQLGAKPIPTGRSPAVFDAAVVCSLLGVLASSFLMDQTQKNRSMLKGRVGDCLYSPLVNIIDDGCLPGGSGSFPFDAEGTPSCKTPLVLKGKLQGFLSDLKSADREDPKARSTGNAVRSNFKEPPHVGVRNFYIESGARSLEDLLKEMVGGLWIRDVIGVHTANAISGDFSLGASGIWMQNGQRQKPVRGITIAGNLHRLFESVEAVGSDRRFYQSYGAPSLLIKSIEIGGV